MAGGKGAVSVGMAWGGMSGGAEGTWLTSVAQATRLPTMHTLASHRHSALPPSTRPNRATRFTRPLMTLLLLEALGALLLLVFIVWWTMFSGRKKGELPDEAEQDKREGAAKRKD